MKKYIAPVGDKLYVIPTGDWRVERPVQDEKKCTRCGLCAMYCPTGSIAATGEEYMIRLPYCKGCGICMAECPSKAITMVEEGGNNV